jgi:hypothetical protein
VEVLEWKDGWHLWDLVAYIAKTEDVRSSSLFRGQSDESWGLLPGLYRREVAISSDTLTKAQLYLMAEHQMLEAFFDRAAMLLPNFPRGPLMDRIIAQHYGVPTQLLDWTVDPLIALFFAVHGGDPTKNSALFYLTPLSRLAGGTRQIELPWTNKITRLIAPVIDERVRAQKSAFTLHSFGSGENFTPLDQRILKISKRGEASHRDDEVRTAGKIIIPAHCRQTILLQLLELGVDSSLVYPGLQGIGQRIADIAHINQYGGGQGY